eukprot:tig00000361_g24370.t1
MPSLPPPKTPAVGGVLEDLIESFSKVVEDARQVTPLQALKGFLHAVDWSEPWIIALVAFHTFVFLFVIITRHRSTVQIVTFLVIMLLVYLSQAINAVCAAHWARFATQPYFDPNGIFISAVFSGPLLLTSIVQLLMCIYQSGSLLIKVKKAELKAQARRYKAAEAAGAGGGAGDAAPAPEGKKEQ